MTPNQTGMEAAALAFAEAYLVPAGQEAPIVQEIRVLSGRAV
jgi:hypothetical protein